MTVIPLNNHDPDRNASGTTEKAPESRSTRGRAPAREGAPNATPSATAMPSERRDRVAGLIKLVRPPELWSEPRPSLQQVWNYARYGPWTDQSRTTPSRAAGIAYAVFVVALTAIGYSLLWVAERPTRAGVAVLLSVLFCLSWLI